MGFTEAQRRPPEDIAHIGAAEWWRRGEGRSALVNGRQSKRPDRSATSREGPLMDDNCNFNVMCVNVCVCQMKNGKKKKKKTPPGGEKGLKKKKKKKKKK